MNQKKSNRRAKRKRRALLRQERRYYVEIRREYRQWITFWLRKASERARMRFDAPSDWLGPLFAEAAGDWARRVERFRIQIRKRANNIAALSTLEIDDETDVDLTIRPFIYEPWLEDEFSDFAAENVRLIKNIGNQTADRLQTIIIDGIKNGTPMKALRADIKAVDKAFGTNRARLIARDQVGKLQANLTRIRAERAGIEKYTWQTSDDERVRPEHAALDGTVREFGKGLEPGQAINCRCVAIPIIPEFE